ncbi:MAG TPA: hypothetical protein VND64_17065 [Pirellulales bacterium]|nr:hypothetical protein [Pirellulales bacterium]
MDDPRPYHDRGERLLVGPRSRSLAPLDAFVLVDSWDTADFQREHFSAFRLHHARGHRFLFLLVGSETDLSPIDMGTAFNREPARVAVEPAGRLISFEFDQAEGNA